jgi:hypothetical protein
MRSQRDVNSCRSCRFTPNWVIGLTDVQVGLRANNICEERQETENQDQDIGKMPGLHSI